MTDPITMPTPVEQVRFALGATGDFASLVTEEEIEFALASYPADWRLAAGYLASNLASRAINDPESFTLTGTMSISWPDRAAAWRSTAWNLRQEAAQIAKQAAAPVSIHRTQLQRRQLDIQHAEYSRPRRR